MAAVQQIQRHWPDTKITWIVGKTEAQLLAGIPDVELISYDKKTGWKGIFALWKQLKSRHFDALLNMQTALRASMISLGINATYKVGFGKKRAREGQGLFTNRKIHEPQSPHVLDGFMAFVAYLGVPITAPQWQLAISDADRNAVAQYVDKTRKNLLISPCSSVKLKKIGWLNVMPTLPISHINTTFMLFFVLHQQNAKKKWYKKSSPNVSSHLLIYLAKLTSNNLLH